MALKFLIATQSYTVKFWHAYLPAFKKINIRDLRGRIPSFLPHFRYEDTDLVDRIYGPEALDPKKSDKILNSETGAKMLVLVRRYPYITFSHLSACGSFVSIFDNDFPGN